MTINKMKDRLSKIILERSFKYSDDPPFTLASGKQSNYYFNCKPTTLDPEGMNLIGAIIFDMLKDTDITAAGGLTLGAVRRTRTSVTSTSTTERPTFTSSPTVSRRALRPPAPSASRASCRRSGMP